ncbi:MAG: hypothetical protein RSA66_08555 [Muribaculaceae bacterium]
MKNIIIYFLAMVISCCLVSCKEKKENNDISNSIGKYLYITNNGVIHTTKHCMNVFFAKDRRGHDVDGMTFVDTLNIISDDNLTYCTECFDDEAYEHVQKLIVQNSEIVANSIVTNDGEYSNTRALGL